MAFPPYRYVPGLQPHPLAHEGGHRCAGAPAIGAWTADLPLERDVAWLGGLDLFDHRYFWESHELWEQRWHQVDRGHPTRDLLQGMIQAAATVLRLHAGDARAAGRLLGRVELRLGAVAAVGPGCGFDLAAFVEALRGHVAGGPYPVAGAVRR